MARHYVRTLFGGLAVALFVVAMPVLIFVGSAFALMFDPGFYSQGQIQQQVEQTYGLPQRVLVPVNRGIVRYFASDSETLAQSLSASGADPTFYNERETVHMNDVRGLIRFFAMTQRWALIYGIIFMIGSLVILRTRAVEALGYYLLAGVAFTVLLAIVAGALTAIDFNALFVRFHLLSFSNDFWLLDPRTDRLVQMFPFEFWYGAMVSIVVRSLLVTLGVGVFGVFFVWLGRRLL